VAEKAGDQSKTTGPTAIIDKRNHPLPRPVQFAAPAQDRSWHKAEATSESNYNCYQINCRPNTVTQNPLGPSVAPQPTNHDCLSQDHPITHQADPAIQVVAALDIINAIAVADIEAALAAIPPNCVLDEPGKGLRKRWIELPGIDPLGHVLNDVGAAAESVASQPVLVLRLEPLQDPGPVQKIVHQGVDGDHAAADLGPEDHLFGSAEQKAGQGHGEDLVRDTIDLPHRLDQGRRHSRQPVRARRTVGGRQLGVDPADQVAVGKVADEQEQRIGGLVEVAIPQVMARQRAAANVLGLGTGPAGLFVSAAMEMPVGLELGATDTSAELLVDVAPGRPAVPLHVIVGDRIGDALIAHSGHQPIEHDSRVAVPDCRLDLVSPQVGSNVVNPCC
jgi:hypothetical protein